MVDARECRLWLPKELCDCVEVGSALVGWVNEGPGSVDVVVVSACPLLHHTLNSVKIRLQEVLDTTETTLPHRLRTERKLRVVGEFVPEVMSGNPMDRDGRSIGSAEGAVSEICTVNPSETGRVNFLPGENNAEFHPPTRSSSGIASDANVWAVVSARRSSGKSNELHRILYLRSVAFKRCPPFVKDHTIVYRQPVFGSHHFSCIPWNKLYDLSAENSSSQRHNTSFKQPQWLTALEQSQDGPDLDSILWRDPMLTENVKPPNWRDTRAVCQLLAPPSSEEDSEGEHGTPALTTLRKYIQTEFEVHEAANKKVDTACSTRGPRLLSPEMVMVELNCAAFINGAVNGVWHPAGTSQKFSTISSICCQYLWCPIAAAVAMWATMLYVLARTLVLVLAVWLPTFPYLGYLLKRSMTCQTMHIKCQQLMAWPFVLLWGGLGPEQPNVAAAHKMTITRHSTWSALLIDKTIGAITGFLVLKHHVWITQIVVRTGQSLTNDVLRTGCVWLMGVPAGFKLNNELAAAFGTLSLHLIQSWSTVLYTLMPAIEGLLRILGICGFFLGFTVMAAMISDVLFFSTLHVLCLHHTIAFLHTNQLRALAALWRLFRGRKRNSLRGRLDTFDCTVEQLVVGSLMFTPLLLLLPTTSIYYTFFTIIFLTLSSIQVMLQCMIAIFYCFPFSLVAMWITQPKQFPTGVLFQLPESTFTVDNQQWPLLSMLGIQTASLAELLKPFIRRLLVTLEWSSAASFVYKVVSGERTVADLIGGCHIAGKRDFVFQRAVRYNLKMRLGIFASLPHIPVSLNGFAWLCYVAVANTSYRFLSK